MRAILFFLWLRQGRRAALAALCALFSLVVPPAWADAPVTLLVPSRPVVSKTDTPSPTAAAPKAGAQSAEKTPAKTKVQGAGDVPSTEPAEVDILLSMMRPFLHAGVEVDMPQLFAVLRHDADPAADLGGAQPERRDLLGDVEEIRYLDHKAWGANVALDKPGLYQFIVEGRPWWDEDRQTFLRHQATMALPVHGVDRGWNEAAGQSFEIVPLTRPFGLSAPALFSGRILLDGKPLAAAKVRMVRINSDGAAAPTPWHEDLAGVSNSDGEFSFLLSQPGWWCCEALTAGPPLKGPDGELKPVERGALFWLFVDGSPTIHDADGRKR
ncbi:MAG: DUF4198 domain-containing protein [Desulfovibrio sp.]|uniref:DUF4198 domain-containing protein n=1 Tax=Desulfovibrio sp. TaxID=885 RepID=UPI001A6C75F7|nr:DUF4198 domain-containing protein [Desulfovibrio sp.]MBD5417506.1 DUF4198 domain-containing protein [Desulfovibrio sp.]